MRPHQASVRDLRLVTHPRAPSHTPPHSHTISIYNMTVPFTFVIRYTIMLYQKLILTLTNHRFKTKAKTANDYFQAPVKIQDFVIINENPTFC